MSAPASTSISAALRALLPGDAQGCDQAAWTRLTAGLESLTGADIQQRFAAERIQITLDAAVQFKVDAVVERPGAELPVVTFDNKHPAPLIDCDDGSKCHAASHVGAAIVAEGGAV